MNASVNLTSTLSYEQKTETQTKGIIAVWFILSKSDYMNFLCPLYHTCTSGPPYYTIYMSVVYWRNTFRQDRQWKSFVQVCVSGCMFGCMSEFCMCVWVCVCVWMGVWLGVCACVCVWAYVSGLSGCVSRRVSGTLVVCLGVCVWVCVWACVWVCVSECVSGCVSGCVLVWMCVGVCIVCPVSFLFDVNNHRIWMNLGLLGETVPIIVINKDTENIKDALWKWFFWDLWLDRSFYRVF